jgi:hypothetical protein
VTGPTFEQRLDVLREMTGCREGKITGQVTVDQVYAHFQHERTELHHPRGGGPFFLRDPLLENYQEYLERYARQVLVEDDGGQRAMADAMEDLAGDGGAGSRAPLDFGDLRRSGHPTVTLGDDHVIYDRAPDQHRLATWELRLKSRLRKLPPALIGYIWWKVMHHQLPPPHLRGRH